MKKIILLTLLCCVFANKSFSVEIPRATKPLSAYGLKATQSETESPTHSKFTFLSKTNEDISVSIDKSSIYSTGTQSKIMVLYQLKQPIKSNKLYWSTVPLQEYDCLKKRVRLWGETFYTGNNGDGESEMISHDMKWVPVKAGTVDDELRNYACGFKKLQ